MNSCCKAVLIACGVIFGVICVGGAIGGIAVGVMRGSAQSTAGTDCPRSGGSCTPTPTTSNEFSAGFQQCCPSTASQLNLGQDWTDSCLNLVSRGPTDFAYRRPSGHNCST